MASRKAKNKSQRKPRKLLVTRKAAVRTPAMEPLSAQDASFLELKPQAFSGELVEDVAVYAKAAREQLSEDLSSQAAAVASALDHIYKGSFDSALEELKPIPLASPYSDWRLFARGLIAYYREDLEGARKNWQRLDSSRRPARIANVLLVAEAQAAMEGSPVAAPATVEVVKQLRNRPAVVEAAKRIVAMRTRGFDTVFSAAQTTMLAEFQKNYRKFDAEFVKTFSQQCLLLSTFQPHQSIFESLKKLVPGSLHDPRWNLLSFTYYLQFPDTEKQLTKVVEDFNKLDLPQLSHWPEALRKAVVSHLYFIQAVSILSSRRERLMRFFFRGPELGSVEELARLAAQSYPAHREAHLLLIDLIEQQIDEDRYLKEDAQVLSERLVQAKRDFAQAFPHEVETVLWLIDHYFDEDDLAQVESLVQKLSALRLDAPQVKSLPWKLKIREAMRLSRRKNQVPAARVALEAAEELWPAWLRRDWLPFLKAALELRVGDQESFSRLVAEARQASQLPETAADTMLFAALQHMNISGADLKPYRTRVEQQIAAADKVPFEELLGVAAFLGDLTRTGLRHKGYRVQAAKLGKILCTRLNTADLPPLNDLFFDAVDWGAAHSFWRMYDVYKTPGWAKPLSLEAPRVAAAVLEWLLGQTYNERAISEQRAEIKFLLEAAKTERNPFYRYRFGQIAKDANLIADRFDAQVSSRRSSWLDEDDDDYDDDDDDEYDGDVDLEGDDESDDFLDEPCNCPVCRRERGELVGSQESDQARGVDQEIEAVMRDFAEELEGLVDAAQDGPPMDQFFGLSPPPQTQRPTPVRLDQGLTGEQRHAARQQRKKELESRTKKSR